MFGFERPQSAQGAQAKCEQPRRPSRQRGDTLLGLLLATALGAAAVGTAIQMQVREAQRQDAQRAGVLVAQKAEGLQRLIAAIPGNPVLMPGGVQTGVDWLKSPSCGGPGTNPAQGFVPCSFGDGAWTPIFQTTLTNVAGVIEARMTFRVSSLYDVSRAGILADIIAEHANSNTATGAANAPMMGFITVMSHVPVVANNLSGRPAIRANTASPDFSRIVAVVSNDNNAIFLRTDGTNAMNAALNLNNNNLVGGNNLQAVSAALSGNVTADTATIARTLTMNLGGATRNAGCGPNGSVASDATGQIMACQNGVWFPMGRQRVVNNFDACTSPGAYGELASDGTGMICQGSRWIPIQARMGGVVQFASFLATNLQVIPKPNCAAIGGVARIFVTPRVWHDGRVSAVMGGTLPNVTITSTAASTPWGFSATDLGANWQVNIQADRGAAQSWALVNTACAFN